MAQKDLMTSAEVAQALNISTSKIHYLVRQKIVEPSETAGSGAYLFDKEKIRRFRFVIEQQQLGAKLRDIKERIQQGNIHLVSDNITLPSSRRIVAFTNQKGGVGKTTTCVNVAGWLAYFGCSVLVLDLDPQANATRSLGFDDASGERLRSVRECSGDENLLLDHCIVHTKVPRLDLVPSSIKLAALEVDLLNHMARDHFLAHLIRRSSLDYHFILIDTPPSLGVLTINALTAADGFVLPMQSEYLSLDGFRLLSITASKVRELLNENLTLDGIVITMYDARTAMAETVRNKVSEYMKDERVFQTIVPRSADISQAQAHGQPIHLYAPKSPAAQAYRLITMEMLGADVDGDLQEVFSVG